MYNYPVPKFWLPHFWSLLAAAASPNPNIIICRTRFFSTSLFAIIYAKLKRIPILHIEHGSTYTTFNSRLKTFLGIAYDRTLGRSILRHADHIVGNSKATAAFVKMLSEKECTVIYRGVETENILGIQAISTIVIPDLIRDPGFRIDGKTIIGYVGRLIDGKGVADLLTALEDMKRTDFHCFIIGEGPEREKLESMAQQPGLNGKITFFGHQTHDQAIALMKACDIIVNPSYGEGLPTSVTEAALCKKAIIATDVGGTPEIITGDGDGFLIPAGRPTLLREKIAHLIDNPDVRERFGEKAYTEVKEKFSWDLACDRYLEIFSELLENRKG